MEIVDNRYRSKRIACLKGYTDIDTKIWFVIDLESSKDEESRKHEAKTLQFVG